MGIQNENHEDALAWWHGGSLWSR